MISEYKLNFPNSPNSQAMKLDPNIRNEVDQRIDDLFETGKYTVSDVIKLLEDSIFSDNQRELNDYLYLKIIELSESSDH